MIKKILLTGILIIGLFCLSLNAQTWSHLKRLTWNSGHSIDADITTSSGNTLHLVWQDSSSTNPAYEIYYKRSTDGGAGWAGTKKLTWASGDAYNLDFTADSNDVLHLIWQEKVMDVKTIFYKKSTNSGASGIASTRRQTQAGLGGAQNA